MFVTTPRPGKVLHSCRGAYTGFCESSVLALVLTGVRAQITPDITRLYRDLLSLIGYPISVQCH